MGLETILKLSANTILKFVINYLKYSVIKLIGERTNLWVRILIRDIYEWFRENKDCHSEESESIHYTLLWGGNYYWNITIGGEKESLRGCNP